MTEKRAGTDQSDGEPEDDDPLIGKVVDERFQIEELLGEGGVGRVFRATQLSVGRAVAIKVLRGDFRHDSEYQQRFMREARVISGFNHPNIVRLIDFGSEEADFSYLVMELVEGVELGDLLGEEKRLEQRFATEVIYQSAGALVEAHGADVIHRDLKAENILLVPMSTGGFQAKVLDFGVAFPTDTDTRLTANGEIFGTPAYMSPEQGKGEHVGSESDLYSLGVILFEMLVGRLPFQADSTLEMMVKRIEEEPPQLAEVTPFDLAPGLDRLVEDLLAKDPEDRPSDAKTVRARIDEIRERANWDDVEIDTDGSMENAFDSFVLDVDEEATQSASSVGLSGDQMDGLVPEENSELDSSLAEAIAEEPTEITDISDETPAPSRGTGSGAHPPPSRETGSGSHPRPSRESGSGSHAAPSRRESGSGPHRTPSRETSSHGGESLELDRSHEGRASNAGPSREATGPSDSHSPGASSSGEMRRRTESPDRSTNTSKVGASDASEIRSALDEAEDEDEAGLDGWAVWGTVMMFGLAAVVGAVIMFVQSRGDGRGEAAESTGVPTGTEAAGGTKSGSQETAGVAAASSDDVGGDASEENTGDAGVRSDSDTSGEENREGRTEREGVAAGSEESAGESENDEGSREASESTGGADETAERDDGESSAESTGGAEARGGGEEPDEETTDEEGESPPEEKASASETDGDDGTDDAQKKKKKEKKDEDLSEDIEKGLDWVEGE